MTRRVKRLALGDYRLVADFDALTDEERLELPPAISEMFHRWWGVRHCGEELSLPPCLSWAEEALRTRAPVLERVVMHEGLRRWEVRLLDVGQKLSPKIGPCLGCAATPPTTAQLPEPLAWLRATFGTTTLEQFTSGTAPWGRSFAEMLGAGELLLSSRVEEGLVVPPSCRDWVVLYEADGDAVCADLEGGGTYWTGSEHAGEAFTDLQLSWTAAVQFILWRMIDHRKVLPTDLRMMRAAVTSR